MNHTPGPWSIWTSNSYLRIGSDASGGDIVCEAITQRSDGHPDLHFPNGGYRGPDALLIAAAPEMAKALQLLLHALAAPMALHPEFEKWMGKSVVVARVALDKAGLTP